MMKNRDTLLSLAAVGVLLIALLGATVAALRGPDSSAATDQATSAAVIASLAVSQMIRVDRQLTSGIASETDVDQLVQRTASRPTAAAIEFANINIQHAVPRLSGIFFFDHNGSFVLGQVQQHNQSLPQRIGITCDPVAPYCIDTNIPKSGYLGGAAFHASLKQLLATGATVNVTAAFSQNDGSFGSLYTAQAIRTAGSGQIVGAVVTKIDAEAVIAPYVQAEGSHILLLSGNVLLNAEMATYYGRGQLPVVGADTALPQGTSNGLVPMLVPVQYNGAQKRLVLQGVSYTAAEKPVPGTDLSVVAYAPSNQSTGSTSSIVVTSALFVVAMIVNLLLLFLRLPLIFMREHSSQLQTGTLRHGFAGPQRVVVLNMVCIVATCGIAALALTVDGSNYLRSVLLMVACATIVLIAWLVAA